MMTQDAMQKMISGDTDAFCRFYEMYAPAVYKKILKENKDTPKAKEMLKEVFSDCCARMRAAGTDADPMTILLEILCEQKLNAAAEAEKAEAADASVPAAPTVIGEEEYAPSELRPEDVLNAYGKETEPAPIAKIPQETVNASVSTPEPKKTKIVMATDTDAYEPVFEEDEEASDEADRPNLRWLWIVLTVLLSVIFLILVWGVVGILGADGLIPKLNLGYDWFNEHIVSFF